MPAVADPENCAVKTRCGRQWQQHATVKYSH